jgi:glycosyltransferase involved in cell wall biosynthesis
MSHPTQHHAPMFRDLARVPGLEVKVFYAFDHGVRESYDPGFDARFAWDVPLLDGYEHEILRPGYSPRRFGFWETDSPTLPGRLQAFSPHALWVHGYSQRLCWRAVSWARRRCAIVFFGDSELVHHRRLTARAAKRAILGHFFRQCDAFATIGDNNEAYYRHYGVPEAKLFRGAYPVDVTRFTRALRATGRMEMRRRYGLAEDDFVVVALGKLERRKRPQDLVEALSRLGPGVPARALFIGDGPERGAVLELARRRGFEQRVAITGFVNQREIPVALQAGDALAMMSDCDPHPLAVTEALAVGLPIIVSDRVGCVGPTDTARPDVNAIVYACGDAGELARAIARLAGDGRLRRGMAEASRRIVKTQDVSAAVGAVLRIVTALRPRFGPAWSVVSDGDFARIALHGRHLAEEVGEADGRGEQAVGAGSAVKPSG